MEQAVTELVIDGRGALATLGAVEAAADRYDAKMAAANVNVQRAIEQQTITMSRGASSVDSVSRAYDRLRGSIDPVVKAQLTFEREMVRAQTTVSKAVMMGVTTETEAAATIARLRDQQIVKLEQVRAATERLSSAHREQAVQAANQNVPGGGTFNSANIAAQFQDIGVTAAMGMSPLQIALQQGTQLSAIFEQIKSSGQSVGSTLVSAFTSIISPISLVTIAVVALGAAALQWFTSTADKTKRASDAAQEYVTSLNALRTAYGDAGAAAEAFTRQSEAQIAAAERVSRQTLERAAREEQQALRGRLGNSLGIVPDWLRSNDVEMVFAPFAGAIDQLRTQLRDGKPDFDAFNKSVQETANQDPARLQTWAAHLLQMTSSAEGTQRILDGTRDALMDLSDIDPSTVKAQQQITAIGDVAERTTARLRDLMVQGVAISKMLDGMDALARGVSPRGDAVGGPAAMERAQKEFEASLQLWRRFGYDDDSGVDPNKPKKAPVDRDANAYRDLIKNADDRIAQMRVEIGLVGQVGAKAAALRYEQELLNQATDKGRTMSPAQLAEIRKKAEAYGELTEQLANTRLAQDLMFEREQMFRSPIDQRIASTMRGAGLKIDFDSPVAGMIRLNEQLKIGADLTKEMASGFINDLMQGEGVLNALTNAAGRLAERLLQMALDQAIAALFGNLTNTMFFNPTPNGFRSMMGYADGGYTGSGGRYAPAGIVHRGEYVFSKPAVDRAGVSALDSLHRSLNGFAVGGHVPSGMHRLATAANSNGGGLHVQVDVTEAPGHRAEVRQTDDGVQVRILPQIMGAVAEDIAKGGPVARQLQGQYGLKRVAR